MSTLTPQKGSLAMNHYGALMYRHYEKHRPQELAAMEDPERFFHDLGEDMMSQIATLEFQIAGGSYAPGQSFPERVAQLNEAKMAAESEVLRLHMEPLSSQD